MSNQNLNTISENLEQIIRGNETHEGLTQVQLVAKSVLELITYLSERYHID